MTAASKVIRLDWFLVVLVVLICYIDTRTQDQEAKQTVCPTIMVSGPAGIPMPGDIIWFEVSVTPESFPNLTYNWEFNKAQITEGQSTKRIGVLYPREMPGSSLTATITILGLPKNCPNSVSENLSICDALPVPLLISDFSNPVASINRPKLAAAAKELLGNPNNQLYIIEYFPSSASRAAVKRKLDLVVDHMIRSLKFDRSRMTIAVAESEDERPRTKVYRIPPGADNPTP